MTTSEAELRSERDKRLDRFNADARPKNAHNVKRIYGPTMFRTLDVLRATEQARVSDDAWRRVSEIKNWREMRIAKPLREKPLCLLCDHVFVDDLPAMFVRVVGGGTTQPRAAIFSGICHDCAELADLKERIAANLKETLQCDCTFDFDEPAGSA